jgi:hypothetical protein
MQAVDGIGAKRRPVASRLYVSSNLMRIAGNDTDQLTNGTLIYPPHTQDKVAASLFGSVMIQTPPSQVLETHSTQQTSLFERLLRPNPLGRMACLLRQQSGLTSVRLPDGECTRGAFSRDLLPICFNGT